MISFLENHEKRELCERKTKKIADSLDFYEKYKTEVLNFTSFFNIYAFSCRFAGIGWKGGAASTETA